MREAASVSAALRCDGCGAVVTVDDPTHAVWLQVDRNGQGLGPIGPIPSVVLNSVYITGGDEDPGVEVDEQVEGNDEPAPTRHFCSWACLASYAVQAEAIG